jgi:tRNA A37 N6-isopentenylltransferase MiaA
MKGKSLAAIEIAKRFDGEVVNADSLQLYRGIYLSLWACLTLQ